MMNLETHKNTPLDQIVREFRFVIDLMPQMVWATQPDGYHDFYNQRWYDFTGLSFQETKDKGWSFVLHPDDFERTWEVWQHSLNTGSLYEIEYRMRKFDGSYKWFLARAQPLCNENGKILKWFGTCTDIHDQRQLLDELQQTKTELHRANKELKNSNEELTRINLELDNFVYSASHDLKAPLNNLEGLMDLLDPSSNGESMQEEILKMMGDAVKRYKQVIDDMTMMAQTAKFEKATPKVDLLLLLNEVETDLRDIIASTDTSVIKDLDIQFIRYTKKDVRSILFNLISNAIKYRNPSRSPVITVTTKADSEGIRIEVEDNGSGIRSEFIPNLFDKYYRINTSVGGSGLGLYIVKRLVENRGGKISVASTEGKGSKFSVFLRM